LCKARVEWGPDFDNAFVVGHYQMSKEIKILKEKNEKGRNMMRNI
jgi:hypothetical protein